MLSTMHASYAPAGFYTDSDDDSDQDYGFYAGSKPAKSKSQVQNGYEDEELKRDQALSQAVTNGNLEETIRLLGPERNLSRCLRTGWPLLFHACDEAKLEIVRYLLEDRKVDVNEPFGLKTPLMLACESKQDSEAVGKVVELLLDYGAVINCRDSYGMTPLMFAVQGGHTAAVKAMIDQVALEATDNEGLTALFHAINNERTEIVGLLLKAGSMIEVTNRRGFTPKQEAAFRGLSDIVALFPPDKDNYALPEKYLQYAHLEDICYNNAIAREGFPEYCQEIGLLLYGMNSEQHLELFAKANVGLLNFLSITDEELKNQIGLELPFERKRIHYGLMQFHKQPWSGRSLEMFPKNHQLDSYDMVEFLCNALKQLTIVQGSARHIEQKIVCEQLSGDATVQEARNVTLTKLHNLRQRVIDFSEELDRIHEITAAPAILHIDESKYSERSSNAKVWFWRVVKVSLVSGLVIYFVHRRIKRN